MFGSLVSFRGVFSNNRQCKIHIYLCINLLDSGSCFLICVPMHPIVYPNLLLAAQPYSPGATKRQCRAMLW